MDVKELRVGNYVYTQSGKLVVNRDSIYKVENVNMQSARKYEPIPLTEEWLMKFGFEKEEVTMLGTTYVGFLRFSFHLDIKAIENSFFYHWMGGNTDVKHVHQLQNLFFALTGEELQLK